MNGDEPQDISFVFVLGEFIASFTVIFLSFGPLIVRVSNQIRKGHKLRNMNMVYLAMAFWISIVIKTIFKVTVWTDLVMSLHSECRREHLCRECDRFWRVNLVLNQCAILLSAMMYCVVSRFREKHQMQWINAMMIIFVVLKLLTCIWIMVSAEGCTRIVKGQSFAICRRHQSDYMNGQQQIIGVVYCLMHFAVAMLLNGIFLRKIFSVIFRANQETISKEKALKTEERKQRAMDIVIRHCLLTTLLALSLLIRPTLRLCGLYDFADSLWIDLVGGCAIFLYFPFANKQYRRYFGWIHRWLFAKWRTRHLSGYPDAMKFDILERRSPLKLGTIMETEGTLNILENENKNIRLNEEDITSLSAATNDTNPLEINFDYLTPFEEDVRSVELDEMSIVDDIGDIQNDQRDILEELGVDENITESSAWKNFLHLLSVPKGRPNSQSFR